MDEGNISDGHPDLAELDAFRTGEAAEEVRAHLDGCERCREVVRELSDLAGELRTAAQAAPLDVPEELDARILAAARGRSMRIARRPVYLRWPGLVAAAASVLLAAGLFSMVGGRRAAPEAVRPAGLAMDIDGSGAVDIVDAYLMSRRLRSREAAPSWDFDRDGKVGDADVKLVAWRAVALAEGGI